MANKRGTYKQECQQSRSVRPPLDPASLRELALAYVARFATSSGRLEDYLRRKLRERGWSAGDDDGEGGAADAPDLAALVQEFAECGYLDDAAYARSRSADLLRRGYGARRVGEALRQAGIDEEVRAGVAPGEAAARQAALRLVQRRRFGPYATGPVDPSLREKQLAAMLRAGHALDIARNLLNAGSQDAAQAWAAEYDEEQDDGFA